MSAELKIKNIQIVVLTLIFFLSLNTYAEINVSSDRNPKYNSNINPKYNSNLNPKYNSNINPKYNSNINPKYNSNINPRYNRSINGIYIFSLGNDVTGFTVFADGVGICFNESSNLNGYLIPHDKGFNFYNKDMILEQLWLDNSSSGYNIFDLSNVWIGYAN